MPTLQVFPSILSLPFLGLEAILNARITRVGHGSALALHSHLAVRTSLLPHPQSFAKIPSELGVFLRKLYGNIP